MFYIYISFTAWYKVENITIVHGVLKTKIFYGTHGRDDLVVNLVVNGWSTHNNL